MDKNTLIGFLLIGVVLFAFSWLNQPTPEQVEAQRRYQDSIAQIEHARQLDQSRNDKLPLATAADSLPGESDSARIQRIRSEYDVFADAVIGEEQFTTLENDKVEIRFTNKGGRVYSARLKDYKTHDSLPLILFEGDEALLDFTLVTATNRVVNTAGMYFQAIPGNDPNTLTMRLSAGDGRHLDFTYTLSKDDYMVKMDIKGTGLNGVLSPSTNALDINWEQKIRQQEKGRKFEDQYAAIYYKFVADDVEYLSETKNDSKQLSNRLKWIAYKDKFFSTVLISEDGFEATNLASNLIPEGKFIKECKTTTSVPFDLRGEKTTSLRYFFGPNKYNLLAAYDNDVASADKLELERLVPLGASVFRWINQYFILPLFNFFGNFIGSYGLIIFLLTLLVKIILFPLTYKSYMSSAKMRVLRPQVEEINAKFPGQEKALERQKATMELYSRAGASPMSGCLPMLLQMPILIAMYMFFPSSIELRHESFLWAKDLSTYDAVISWTTNIPLITPYFGNHISLFCLLMTITNIIYTKFNMDQTNTGQQQMPGMKAMMYMMPLMFLVFFNQNASGLSYYYFISTLITIVQTLIFRYTINEDKLLAKLEANKKKPAKKSGFMKRLEDAQRAQQEQLKKQQKGKK